VRLRPQRVDLAEGQRGGLGHQAIHPQPPVLWCVANPAGTGCAGSASRRSGCSCIRLSLAHHGFHGASPRRTLPHASPAGMMPTRPTGRRSLPGGARRFPQRVWTTIAA
jgi:hypothetical protein